MRIPDPKANTTTEAYLAYKAGYLEESELKPVLYEPYLHFDAWLAYWAGLTTTYPVTISKKNLFDISKVKSNTTSLINNGDGTITVNTSASSSSVGSLPPNRLSDYCPNLKVGDTATLSLETTGTERYIYLYGTGANVVWTSGYSKTITQAMLDAQVLWYASGVSSTATISNVQLELGSSATSYEPYATPEMLTDEEALVAYLSGVTNTYPEEIKDPYDVRIVGYLKHLVSARWPEPDYPVNNEEFYLSTMKPPVVTNDTPSSSIELDDTAEAPFIDVKMYGDTIQNTYTGKNLFDVNGVSAELTASFTISGNDITATMTSTGGNKYSVIEIPNGDSLLGETVMLSYVLKNVSGENSARLSMYFGTLSNPAQNVIFDGVAKTSSSVGETVEKTVTIPSSFPTSGQSIFVIVYANTNNTSVSTIESAEYSNIQLEVGSTATSYEPYVGGVPAPNPDYPQAVNVVTGRQMVSTNTQNLFDTSDAEIGFYTNTGKFEQNTATALRNMISDFIDFSKWDNIEASCESAVRFLGIVEFDEDKNFLARHQYSNSKGAALSLLENTNYVRVYINVDDTNMDLEKLNSVSPKTIAIDEYEINLTGKNLVKFDNQNLAQNAVSSGIATMSFTDNTITFENTAETSSVVYAYYYTPELNADITYTLSYTIEKIACLTNNRVVFSYSDDGTTWANNTNDDIALDAGQTYYATKTFTGHKFYRFGFYNNTSSGGPLGTRTIFKNIQIEKGSTATPYAPYRTPIELCKIGNYQDYIYQDADGDWYVYKEIKKIVLDGSETWYEFAQSYSSAFITEEDAINPSSRTTGIVISDRFIEGASTTSASQWNNFPDGTVAIRQYGTEPKIGFKSSVANNLTSWKTWLNTHNTTVYYVLATPTNSKIVYTDLIDQLNALKEGGSYTGKTYITVTSTAPNLPALLKVEAGEYH